MFSNNIIMPYNKVFTACALCLSVSAFSYTSPVLSQIISGKIVNHQDKPISGAQVKINGRDKVIITNAQGLFTLSGLSAGKIELHTSAKNYAHDNQYIIINQDDILGVNIKL